MPVLNLGIPLSQYPPELDSESGRCLVAGGAGCVWSDIEEVPHPYKVLCINDIGMHFPGPVHHLYSNNNEYLPKWQAARRDQYIAAWGPIEKTHSNITGGQVTWPWPGCGTSALGAVYTALALGFDDVWICGVPLDNSPHYFEGTTTFSNFNREVPMKGDGQRIKYWSDAFSIVFQGRVRAVSGRLADIL